MEAELKKRISALRLLSGLLLIAVLCLLYPPFFRFGARHLVIFSSSRCGIHLEIAKVGGSLLEPVSFTGMTLSSATDAGQTVNMRIAKLEASFSVSNLLFHHGNGWLKKLVIDGMQGEVTLLHQADGRPAPALKNPVSSYLLPSSIEAKRVTLAFLEKDYSIFLRNIECAASDVSAGTISIEKIDLHQPGLKKTFSNVQGSMALQNSRLTVAALILEEGIRLDHASADLHDLMRGLLKTDFSFSAFGGTVRAEMRGFTRENHHLNFEATGSFSQISISQFAAFLDSTESAGGSIQEGRFSFRGSLRDLERATFSTRFAARDFRWGKRQWNSLTLGATLVNRHLQIPVLELRQAHNALSLNGEIAIPSAPENWLQTDFNFYISAKIDNLAELSDLFGPDFASASGKAGIGGSISSRNQSLTGELFVSGSNLSYRNVPIDLLRAEIKLNGNELQIANLEMAGRDDFLRGRGAVNLLAEKRYAGEIKLSIADLSQYAAILQPPLLPQSYAGSLILDWSGDGAAQAHSGAFHAELKKFRPLVETTLKSHPINADIEGTYSPENIFLSRLLLSHSGCSVSAKIAATPQALHVENLKLERENEVQLEGDAVLPVNLWQAWRNMNRNCWNPNGDCKFNLSSRKLDLHEALQLTGREFPLKGEIQAKLTAFASAAGLSATGEIKLVKGQIPVGSDLMLSEASATLDGQRISLEKLAGRFQAADFTGSGEVHVKRPDDPVLGLRVHAKSVLFKPAPDLKIKADLDLRVDGPASASLVTGTARILSAELSGKRDLAPLFLMDGRSDLRLEPSFAITRAPFDRWRFDLVCASDKPLKPAEGLGLAWPVLVLRGGGGMFQLAGSVTFENMTFLSPAAPVAVEQATFFFSPSGVPSMDVRWSAKADGFQVHGYLFGPLDQRRLILISNPSLPAASIRELLAHGFVRRPQAAAPPDFLDEAVFSLESPFLAAPSGRLEWMAGETGECRSSAPLPPTPPPAENNEAGNR